MNIVKERHLWANNLSIHANRSLKLHFDHVAGLEAAAVDYAVNQRLIESYDQRLLVWSNGGYALCRVRRLAAWHQGTRGLGRPWELGQLFRRGRCRASGGL